MPLLQSGALSFFFSLLPVTENLSRYTQGELSVGLNLNVYVQIANVCTASLGH